MNYTNITRFNCDRMRRRLKVEARKLGIPITIVRDLYEPDGMNGFVNKGTKNITNDMIMILIKDVSANEVIVEGGRKITVIGRLIIPYDETLELKKGDYFKNGDRTFYVADFVDVNDMNVYYHVNLVGSLDELNGHG